MRISISLIVAALLALSGCAVVPATQQSAPVQPTVSLVNSLSWTNALTNQPDAMRTAWPLSSLAPHTETFPLAQVKQCDAAGVCRFGMLKAQRTLSAPRQVPGGVALDLVLDVDVSRSHAALQGGETLAMTIPSDVPALAGKRAVRKTLMLPYGKIEHFDLGFGISYDLCVKRLNAAGQALDDCAIPFI